MLCLTKERDRFWHLNLTFGPVLLVGPSGTGKSLTAKANHSELANLNLVDTGLPPLYVEVLYFECVFADEVSSFFDVVSH